MDFLRGMLISNSLADCLSSRNESKFRQWLKHFHHRWIASEARRQNLWSLVCRNWSVCYGCPSSQHEDYPILLDIHYLWRTFNIPEYFIILPVCHFWVLHALELGFIIYRHVWNFLKHVWRLDVLDWLVDMYVSVASCWLLDRSVHQRSQAKSRLSEWTRRVQQPQWAILDPSAVQQIWYGHSKEDWHFLNIKTQ